jgi:hypothetical protein
MAKQTEFQKVRAALEGAADMVGRKRNGNYIARRSFFYTHGFTADQFMERVGAALKKAGLAPHFENRYERWVAFRGGHTVAQGSHWGVEFWVLEPAEALAEVS